MSARRPPRPRAPRAPSASRPSRLLAGVAALALAAGATACNRSDDPAAPSSRPPRTGTAPTGGSESGSVAPPVGVGSLDAVSLRLTQVADLGSAPTSLTARPGSTSLYVTEQDGRVRRIAVTGTGATATYQVVDQVVLDLTDATETEGERGLLGLAFSADGQHLYTYYTARDGGAVTIDEYAMAGEQATTSSRRNLLTITHPRSNHNGGQLQLGPDGFLYAGTGDGGGGGDPDANGQNPDTLLGKLLRIDPTAPADGKPYGIPDGNPFADGQGGAPEVWAFGLRNPWRFSFDRETNDLWIGDVGQNAFEEIDFAPSTTGGAGRGLNFGWNLMEGTHPYERGSPPADHTPPIFDYGRDNGECSVTGGYVYRGPDPGWQGVYVFADYCQAELRVLLREAGGAVAEQGTGVSASGASIPTFGEDADGNLFVLTAEGAVLRIDAT